MKTCETCMHFNSKSDFHGYCLSRKFMDAVDVVYMGNKTGAMPGQNGPIGQEEWMRQQAEIEHWSRIRIDRRSFGCMHHEETT